MPARNPANNQQQELPDNNFTKEQKQTFPRFRENQQQGQISSNFNKRVPNEERGKDSFLFEPQESLAQNYIILARCSLLLGIGILFAKKYRYR